MGPELLFVVGLCGLTHWLARRAKGPAKAGRSLRTNLLSLLPGDVVVHDKADWVVHDAYRLKAGGWRALYRLGAPAASGDGPPLLLSASLSPTALDSQAGDALWLLWPLPGRSLTLPGDKPPQALEHDGVRHLLVGRFRSEAQTQSGGVRRLLLLCYRGPGDHRLLGLRWDGEANAQLFSGRALGPAAVDVLPLKR
jgi:hypothetical protein